MPAQARVQFRSAKFLTNYKRRVAANTQAVASAITQELRSRVGTPYPPPSRPGQPPHRRTGRLQRGINGNTVLSGNRLIMTHFARAPYAAFVAFGTRRMAARQFLFYTRDQIARLLRALRM